MRKVDYLVAGILVACGLWFMGWVLFESSKPIPTCWSFYSKYGEQKAIEKCEKH